MDTRLFSTADLLLKKTPWSRKELLKILPYQTFHFTEKLYLKEKKLVLSEKIQRSIEKVSSAFWSTAILRETVICLFWKGPVMCPLTF